jgi:hypothetical protein
MKHEVSPLISRSIIAVMIFVAIWLVWHGAADRGGRPLISGAALTEQIRGLPQAPGSAPLGEVKFVDRQTFRYVEQNYSTSSGSEEIFRHYRTALPGQGWRADYQGSNEEWFCRNGVLGTVIFWGNPAEYKIRLTTGSSSCGA